MFSQLDKGQWQDVERCGGWTGRQDGNNLVLSLISNSASCTVFTPKLHCTSLSFFIPCPPTWSAFFHLTLCCKRKKSDLAQRLSSTADTGLSPYTKCFSSTSSNWEYMHHDNNIYILCTNVHLFPTLKKKVI